MFRIGICDDDIIVSSQIESILLTYSKNFQIPLYIEVFSCGKELYKFIEDEQSFDLIYLDIEMASMSGIELAHKIRKKMNDISMEIVFISAQDNYDRLLFDVQPLHFIPKPISPQVVIEDLNLAILRSKKLQEVFTYKKGTYIYKVPIKEILYFESFNKEIMIVTTSGEDIFYGKLNETFENVKGYRFIKIHRSYIVNYKHISVFKYDQVIMSNGIKLPISQSHRKRVRQIQLNIE